MATGKKNVRGDAESVVIRTDADLAQAIAELERLVGGGALPPSAQKRMAALASAAEAYERSHHPISEASHAGMIRQLMNAAGLNESQMAHAIGSTKNRLLSILSGAELSQQETTAIAKRFRVSPAAFGRHDADIDLRSAQADDLVVQRNARRAGATNPDANPIQAVSPDAECIANCRPRTVCPIRAIPPSRARKTSSPPRPRSSGLRPSEAGGRRTGRQKG